MQEAAEVRAVYKNTPVEANNMHAHREGLILRNSQCPSSGAAGQHGTLKTASGHI